MKRHKSAHKQSQKAKGIPGKAPGGGPIATPPIFVAEPPVPTISVEHTGTPVEAPIEIVVPFAADLRATISDDAAAFTRRYRVANRHANGIDLYAALDLGTNNCRLLVAEPNRSGFHVVDAFSRIVRLGEGMMASGRLSDIAQTRAIEALHVCRAKLEARGVNRARLVATEACRIAENGADIIARVEHETGLTLEVVSRETEARLAVAGCANLIDWDADGVLLFDIGGGSSELVWLDLTRKSRRDDLTRHIRAWTSLPVGVVTLSERHGGVVVDRRVFEEMVDDVDAMLDGLVEGPELSAALHQGPFHMLGTSGTVTTLAGVHLGLRRYDRRRVDGIWLGANDVGDMIDRLIDMTFEERVANPCIGADRADLVLAGCAILEAIRRRWPCDRLRVADRGLREGILTELMAADGVWRRNGQSHAGPAGQHGVPRATAPGSSHDR
jgi:exopolyphosphatase/guanosine-5'-triphosphate,3'-diphosphate pyrophosphatase